MAEDLEAAQIYPAGLVIRDLPLIRSNWRSNESLAEFLERGRVVAIAGVDTRKLTRILREKGAQAGCIMTGEKVDEAAAIKLARKFPGLKGMDLAKVVTAKRSFQWNEGSVWPENLRAPIRSHQRMHVAAFDFGVKRNILRVLADYGCRITVVPAQTSAEEVIALNADGVFLSNGPGDPEPCDYAINATRQVARDGSSRVWNLPRPPDPGARCRRAYHQDEVRPSRREPPRAGPRLGTSLHHESESRIRRGRGDPAGQCQTHSPVVVRWLVAGNSP